MSVLSRIKRLVRLMGFANILFKYYTYAKDFDIIF